MPTFYNFTQDGLTYSFDDIFVPAEFFTSGNLWNWGTGSDGQLAINSVTTALTPVTTFAGGTNWKQVSCGGYHAAAIKTDGSLWLWGSGPAGRLGDNDTISKLTPVTTFAGGTNWKQVSCGLNHTAAIKTDGTLWTWGYGFSGKLGTNDTTTRLTPVTIFGGGSNWRQVDCGGNHTAAIKTDGSLWVWGNGSDVRLGTNNVTSRSTPVTTFAGGNDWKQVSCASNHTAAIKFDGTLWVWGLASSGQLGTNQLINKSTPVTTFAGGNDWKQVSCGTNITAAVKQNGTLWIWGLGSNGRLGTNDVLNKSTPVTTFAGGNNWKQVSCASVSSAGSSSHVAAVKSDGTLWTWGYGNFGRLGTNDNTNRITPVTTFTGGNSWKQVSCSAFHTAALTYTDDII